jgi:hypothetical protein
MIARIPQVVSRTIASALVATTLAFGAATLAAPYPTQLDPATTYGWITVDQSGGVVNPYDSDTNSAIISVPASSFFGARTPSVTADGTVVDEGISLSAVNAPEGLEFTLESVKLVRSDSGKTLQLEIAIKDKGASVGTHGVQFQLENKTTGGVLNFGTSIDVQ